MHRGPVARRPQRPPSPGDPGAWHRLRKPRPLPGPLRMLLSYMRTLTSGQSLVTWLSPPGEGATHSASELSGAYCCFVVEGVTAVGIYETEWHWAVKIKALTKARGHSTSK